MPNTDCFIQQKAGINQIVMLPSPPAEQRRLGAWDAVLLFGFLSAFVGLVFLLAK
jgi:hypothetical protein